MGYDVEIFEANGEKKISTSYPNIYILLPWARLGSPDPSDNNTESAENLYPTTPFIPAGMVTMCCTTNTSRITRGRDTSPLCPHQHLANTTIAGGEVRLPRPPTVGQVVTGSGTRSPLGWSQLSVGARSSGLDQAARTQDDAEVEERDRGIRAGPTGPRCVAARHD